MNCLRCGQEIHAKTCSHCGYTIQNGARIVSLFKLDIEQINRELEIRRQAEENVWREAEKKIKEAQQQAEEAQQQAEEAQQQAEEAQRQVEVYRRDAKQQTVSNKKEVPAGFVFVQGGTFTMGSPASEPGRSDDEGPQHQVTVSSFYMGKYEVTQKEWQEVMGTNPSYLKGDKLPVECVSWYEAIEYCNKRSQREGLSPAYTIDKSRSDPNNTSKYDNVKWTVTWNRSANGYRLPTEAEWEYACRAGTTTPYYTGSSVDAAGWYNGNSGSTTHPVGQKQANAWGLYDMHGNVWEWCWDWYGSYSSGFQTDPTGAGTGLYRVARGGSCYNFAQDICSANRIYFPSFRINVVGFRLVCS